MSETYMPEMAAPNAPQGPEPVPEVHDTVTLTDHTGRSVEIGPNDAVRRIADGSLAAPQSMSMLSPEGELVDVDGTKLAEALEMGLRPVGAKTIESIRSAPPVRMVAPDGEFVDVEAGKEHEARRMGLRPATDILSTIGTPQELQQVRDERAAEYDTPFQQASTALEGFTDGATMGLAPLAQRGVGEAAEGLGFIPEGATDEYFSQRARREIENPNALMGGQVGGVVTGMLALPLGNGVRSAAMTRAATQTGAKAMGTRVAGEALAGALEAGGAGLTRRVAESLSGNPDADAENVLLGASKDALLGGALGLGFGAVSQVVGKLASALKPIPQVVPQTAMPWAAAPVEEVASPLAAQIGKTMSSKALGLGAQAIGLGGGGPTGWMVGKAIEELASDPTIQKKVIKAIEVTAGAASKGAAMSSRWLPRVVEEIDGVHERPVPLTMDDFNARMEMNAAEKEALPTMKDVSETLYGPDIAARIEAAQLAQIDFLEGKMNALVPKTIKGDLEKVVTMSKGNAEKLTAYIKAVDDPNGAMMRLARGRGTAQDREVMQAFYPQALSRLQQSTTELLMASKKPIPRMLKARLDRTLGTTLTRGSDRTYVTWLQKLSAQPTPENGDSVGGGKPRPSGKSVSVTPLSPTQAVKLGG